MSASNYKRRPHLCTLGNCSGFTLMELAVILFIMGLMMTIALPYFSSLHGADLRSQARRLGGRASYLFDEAMAQKVVLRLTFDLNSNSYFVYRLDPFASQPVFLPDNEDGAAPVRLPKDVRLRDVSVEGIGTVSRGMVSCLFYPSGYVDATLIHLVSSQGEVMTISIAPLTGRVAIMAGDLTQRAMIAQAR